MPRKEKKSGTQVCKCGAKISFYAEFCRPCSEKNRMHNPKDYKAESNSTIDKNIKPYMLTRYGEKGMNMRSNRSCMIGGEI